MTREEAIRILDPNTRRETMKKIPVHSRIEADQEACKLAVYALRAQHEQCGLTNEQLGRLVSNSYAEGYEDCKAGKPPLEKRTEYPFGEWISVKDKMPEEKEPVAILLQDEQVFRGEIRVRENLPEWWYYYDAAEVAHQLRRCFSDVSQFAESFCISKSVIRFVRCAETGEFVGMCFPVEIAAVYNCSAYAGGVSVHVFGSGVDYYIGSPFKRAAVDRSGESIVYNQRYAVLVGDTGELFDVENFQRRVRDCFAEQGFGVRTESGGDFLFGRIGVDKRYIDTQFFHCHAKQVERSAIDSG